MDSWEAEFPIQTYPCLIFPGKRCVIHPEPCMSTYYINKYIDNKERGEVVEVPNKSVYEITLTTTKDDPKELIGYMDKIIKSKMFGVEYYEYVIELTEKGLPHIHAVIYSNRDKIDQSQIKAKGIKFPYRYECVKVRNLPKYLIYIHKEKHNNIVLQYCEKHNILRNYARLPEKI